jgi:hypothetical protein
MTGSKTRPGSTILNKSEKLVTAKALAKKSRARLTGEREISEPKNPCAVEIQRRLGGTPSLLCVTRAGKSLWQRQRD